MFKFKRFMTAALAVLLILSLLTGCSLIGRFTGKEESTESVIEIIEIEESTSVPSVQPAESSMAESSDAQASESSQESSQESQQESSAVQESSAPATENSSTPNAQNSGSTETPAEALAGTVIYKLVYLVEGDQTADKETLEAMESLGIVSYLYFFADGTGKLDLFGDPQVFTWTEGVMTSETGEIPYTVEGDVLTIDQDEITMQFVKLSDADALIVLNGGTASGSAANPAAPEASPIEIPDDYHEVIVETDDFSFEVIGFSMDKYNFDVKVDLVNKTEETLVFSISNSSVEGLMGDAYMLVTVDGGKTESGTITYSADFINTYIVDFPTWIAFELNVYKASDLDDVYLDYVDIYPSGEDEALQLTFNLWDNDVVLVDNDLLQVIYSPDIEPINTWKSDFDLPLVIINKTETPLVLSANTCAINGRDLPSVLWAQTVAPGCMKYTSFGQSAEDLKQIEVSPDSVNAVSLSFSIVEDHSYDQLGEGQFLLSLE